MTPATREMTERNAAETPVQRMVRRVRCAVGAHPYSLRELHATEPVEHGKPVMLMAIIERCECGHSRIAPHGGSMPTKTGLCVPEKYMPAQAPNAQVTGQPKAGPG